MAASNWPSNGQTLNSILVSKSLVVASAAVGIGTRMWLSAAL